jgi:hypothetical protein
MIIRHTNGFIQLLFAAQAAASEGPTIPLPKNAECGADKGRITPHPFPF